MMKLIRICLFAVGLAGFALAGNGNGNSGNGNGNSGNDNDNGHGWGAGGNPKAPEIDPNQAASALALLSGGVLILRRKK